MPYRLFLTLLSTCLFLTLSAQTVRINEAVSYNSLLNDEDSDTPDWFELKNFSAATVDITGWTITDDAELPAKWTFPNSSLSPNGYLKVWASAKDRAYTGQPQSLVRQGDNFRYLVPNQPVPDNWKVIDFNDSDWEEGSSGFGYGDDDDATSIPEGQPSVFLRKSFTITDANQILKLFLDVDFDDSFIAYLNGTEIARANLNSLDPAYDVFADDLMEARIVNGEFPLRYSIDNFTDLLQSGENILSIQAHNFSGTSSDFTLIPFLSIVTSAPESGVPTTVPTTIESIAPICMHTNFKLSNQGETLYLFDAEGGFVDSLVIPALQANMSYGIPQNDPDSYAYFLSPTPAAPNTASVYAGLIDHEVIFSHPGGITDPLSLTLSGNQAGEVIRYTLDATEPLLSSPQYTGPISIGSTQVVRAKIFRSGYISRYSQSRSYLLEGEHALPVVSLITEPDNFFHPQTGIYVLGEGYEGNFPYPGSNIWNDWERPLHVSLYEPNGELGFAMNMGTKIFGGWSRAQPLRSLALYARGQYGLNEIDYPVFPARPYDKYQSIVLRNSGNDFPITMLRDGTLTTLMTSADIEVQAYRPSIVYLNGEFWGIHNIREKVNEHYLESRQGVTADNLDLLERSGTAVHGNNTDYFVMFGFIRNNDMADDANYAYVSEQIDVDNFILYYASQIYFDNTDWPGNNIKYWRPKDGKWRWILYDTDFGFGIWNPENYANNTLSFALFPNGSGWPNPEWSTLMLRKLVQNIGFRNRFINRMADELNSRFLPQRVQDHIQAAAEHIGPEINQHLERWDGFIDDWFVNIENMKNFAAQRPAYLKTYVREEFDLVAHHELTIENIEPEQGFVEVNNNLHIQVAEWRGDYFQGVPITLKAVAAPGYVFSHWEGAFTSNDAEIQLDLTTATLARPVFSVAPLIDAGIVINEINYNSSEDFDTGDWVELYNTTTEAVDLSAWVFRDDDDEHNFTFPTGSSIPGNGFLLLTRNLNDFQALYPELDNVIGEFDFGLSSNGDEVRLFDATGVLQDSVAYLSETPWPVEADGQGPTLELISPELDNTLPANWARLHDFGSPGFPNDFSSTTDPAANSLLELTVSPNPSPAQLTASFRLSIAADVQLIVYDSWGARVHLGARQRLLAGEHVTSANLAALPDACYFVSLKINDRHQGFSPWIKQ